MNKKNIIMMSTNRFNIFGLNAQFHHSLVSVLQITYQRNAHFVRMNYLMAIIVKQRNISNTTVLYFFSHAETVKTHNIARQKLI
jgi:hypothetical protein